MLLVFSGVAFPRIPVTCKADILHLLSVGVAQEEHRTAEAGLRSVDFDVALQISRALGRLETGSAGLDGLLGGGYGEGRITELFGASNTGKTQLAIQACVMAAAKGWRSVYVDTESTFRPERLKEIAESRNLDATGALESVYCVRARNVKGQVGVLRRMRDDRRVMSAKLVVVDTLTKNFTLEFPGRERTGRRQGALAAYLDGIAVDAYLNRRVVLLTNRVAAVPRERESQEVSLGGLTLRRFVSRSLRLRREGTSVLADLEPPSGSGPTECHLSRKGFE